MNYFKLKKTDILKLNILSAAFFSIVIFIFYFSYPFVFSKAYILERGALANLSQEYGIWGSINDHLYKFINLLVGNLISGMSLMNFLVGFQISIVYFFTTYQIIKLTSPIAVLFYLSPFLLNYFIFLGNSLFSDP